MSSLLQRDVRICWDCAEDQARAGGAWLGAGPEGGGKFGARGVRAACAGPPRRAGDEAEARWAGGAFSARGAAASTLPAGAAAYDANGSAPAGDSPTSTAAHAAARE